MWLKNAKGGRKLSLSRHTVFGFLGLLQFIKKAGSQRSRSNRNTQKIKRKSCNLFDFFFSPNFIAFSTSKHVFKCSFIEKIRVFALWSNKTISFCFSEIFPFYVTLLAIVGTMSTYILRQERISSNFVFLGAGEKN